MAIHSRRSSLGGPGSQAGAETGEAHPGQQVEPGARTATEESWDTWANSTWSWQPWSWQSGWNAGWGRDWTTSWGSQGTASDAGSQSPEPELIPPFLQGWYLLNDSGLDTRARNAILTRVSKPESFSKYHPCKKGGISSGSGLWLPTSEAVP